MPIPISTSPPTDQNAFLESPPHPKFLVVYASPRPADGLSWCGDCRRAEPLISKKLGGKVGDGGEGGSESVRVVMAGSEVEYVFFHFFSTTSSFALPRLNPESNPVKFYFSTPFPKFFLPMKKYLSRKFHPPNKSQMAKPQQSLPKISLPNHGITDNYQSHRARRRGKLLCRWTVWDR